MYEYKASGLSLYLAICDKKPDEVVLKCVLVLDAQPKTFNINSLLSGNEKKSLMRGKNIEITYY